MGEANYRSQRNLIVSAELYIPLLPLPLGAIEDKRFLKKSFSGDEQ